MLIVDNSVIVLGKINEISLVQKLVVRLSTKTGQGWSREAFRPQEEAGREREAAKP